MVIQLDTYNQYYKKEKHLKPKITRYFSKILISIMNQYTPVKKLK